MSIGIDEQIADEQDMLDRIPETAAYAPMARAKLATLRWMKAIEDAAGELPEKPKPIERLSHAELNAIQDQLNSYRGAAVSACAPKDLLYKAADAIGALRFDRVDNTNITTRHIYTLRTLLAAERANRKAAEENVSELMAENAVLTNTLNTLSKYEAINKRLAELVSAVTCGGEVACRDVDGKNWFDARAVLLKEVKE